MDKYDIDNKTIIYLEIGKYIFTVVLMFILAIYIYNSGKPSFEMIITKKYELKINKEILPGVYTCKKDSY